MPNRNIQKYNIACANLYTDFDIQRKLWIKNNSKIQQIQADNDILYRRHDQLLKQLNKPLNFSWGDLPSIPPFYKPGESWRVYRRRLLRWVKEENIDLTIFQMEKIYERNNIDNKIEQIKNTIEENTETINKLKK